MRHGHRLFYPLSILSLAVLSAILLGHRLGSTGLWTDESIYAETAREMARSGDWITPELCGRPYLIKPPLYHWIASIAFHALGPSETAPRLPQAAAGTAAVLLVGLLAGKLFDRRTAWLAGAALLTSPGFLIGSRVAGMDVLLTLCVTAAILSFFRGYQRPAARRVWFLTAGYSCGMGMLAKGPLGLFIPALVILLFLAARRDLPLVWSRPALEGSTLTLVVAAVWYAPVWIQHGRDFTRVYWLANNLARITEPVSEHAGPFWFYLPVLVLAFLPWSLPFAVAFVRATFRIGRAGLRACGPEDLILILWFAAPFLFYSAIATKLPGYLLPTFPAAALLLAREWERERAAPAEARRGGFRVACALGAMALPGVALTVPFLLQHRYGVRPGGIWLFPALAFATALVATLSALLSRGRLQSWMWVVAAAVFALGLVRFVVAPIEPFESMKGLTAKLLKKREAGFSVALAGAHLKGTLFYTGCSVPQPRDLRDLPRPGPDFPVYCLVKDRFRPDLEDWAKRGRFHLRTVRSSGALSLVEASLE